MENLGIASVAAITVITYLMGMAVRASRMDNKWIPILCGLLGGLLGLVSFYPLRRWASSAVWRPRGCIRRPSS